MSNINCCIDNKELKKTEDDSLILIVNGWAATENSELVKVSINNPMVYRVSNIIREDLKEIYPDNVHAKYAGFHLEILLDKRVKKVELVLCTETESNVIPVEIEELYAKIEPKFTQSTFKCNMEKIRENCLSGVSFGRLFFAIDGIYHLVSKNEIAIEGWAFSNGKQIEITTNDNSSSYDVVKRQDVYNAFHEKYTLSTECGFRLIMNDESVKEKGIGIELFDCDEEKIRIVVPLRYIEKEVMQDTDSLSDTTVKEFILKKIKYMKNVRMYGKQGAELKKHEYDIFLEENEKNTKPYIYEPYFIPADWIDIQKNRSTVSIVIAINDIMSKKEMIDEMLCSLKAQCYQNFEIILVGDELDEITIHDMNVKKIQSSKREKMDRLYEGYKNAIGKYILFMDQEDMLDNSCLACFIEDINENPQAQVIYADYDIMYKREHLIKVERSETYFERECKDMILTACLIERSILRESSNMDEIVQKVKSSLNNRKVHDERVTYHYNAVSNSFNEDKTKLIAFYLTQYHITEENNKWWGEGFTEWVNVKRGKPMFEGHNQPRIPSELGYYDLVEDRSIQYKQIDLAKQHDIFGFCYYYYWFEGKRLLRKPLDQFVENKELNLPYCICWANETWSKRWDGQDHEILMQQVHNKKTDVQYIKEMIPMFKDDRYIKIDGKPLLLIYRIELFPQPYRTIQRWRKICKKNGIADIHVAIVQSFGVVNPKIYGADSAVEFPPHKIVGSQINERILPKVNDFKGNIYSYKEITDNLSTISARDYSMMVGSMLAWDNTARRMNASNIFAEFDPELFRKWLIKNHYFTKIYREDRVMFINAWNEWAEGTYLEPDQKYGRTFLEISKEVVNYK